MDIPHLLIYSLADGCLGCFQLLAIMNSAAITTCVQVLCEHMFSLLLVINLEVLLRGYFQAVLNLMFTLAHSV